MKKTLLLVLAGLLLASALFATPSTQRPSSSSRVGACTYQMVVESFDWGPGVTKLIIALNETVEPGSVKANEFSVTAIKQSLDFATFQPGTQEEKRVITAAYVSNSSGKPINSASAFVTLELSVSPDTGSPFYFFFDMQTFTMGNMWADPYTNSIAYSGNAIKSFNVNPEPSGKIMPLTDRFDITGKFTASDGVTLQYASYEPPLNGVKHPLVIWLHGMGEGSIGGLVDPTAVLLGNPVAHLVDTEIQSNLGGSFILAPQAPTMWMDSGDGMSETGATIYLTSLTELIAKYVADHPGVDQNRVYIGGCSNGGYMTMKMLITHPEMFAAAYPICEAYRDEAITDEQIKAIKDIPIWFTQAKSDGTVQYDAFALPTYERLIAAGAKNVYLSLFDNVVDTSGLYKDDKGDPYEYEGHWSWIYTLHNECFQIIDGKQVSIFAWLAAQHR